MQDHDERRGQGRQDRSPQRGWQGQDDDAQEAHGYSAERRTWDTSNGEERNYGRRGGTYGQSDFSRSAQRSPSREGYRYADSGQAGHGGYDAGDRGAGGRDGYSGYGSSGQGQFGPGGFARGGYGASGYGEDYGQDVYRGGEYGRSSPEAHEEFDPDYLNWRRAQMASYDRDYSHWREHQARIHDDDYRRWREERRRKFHDDFHGWRLSRTDSGTVQESTTEAAAKDGDDKD